MHDTGAALRGVAADMGAGQAQILAQELHQQRPRIDICRDGITVHNHGNLGHSGTLFNSEPRRCTAAQPANSVENHHMGHPGGGQPRPDRLPVRRDHPCTALAKIAKNSSASFLAVPLIRRWPSWASLPPIWASTL